MVSERYLGFISKGLTHASRDIITAMEISAEEFIQNYSNSLHPENLDYGMQCQLILQMNPGKFGKVAVQAYEGEIVQGYDEFDQVYHDRHEVGLKIVDSGVLCTATFGFIEKNPRKIEQLDPELEVEVSDSPVLELLPFRFGYLLKNDAPGY